MIRLMLMKDAGSFEGVLLIFQILSSSTTTFYAAACLSHLVGNRASRVYDSEQTPPRPPPLVPHIQQQ